MKAFNKTYISGVICLIFAGWIIWQTGTIGERLVSNEPGAKLFPYISAIGIIVCSILTMIFDGRKESSERRYLTKDGWKRMGIIFAELIVFAVGIHFIGFLFTAIIMMMVLILTLKADKKIRLPFAIVLSVALSAIVYFSFTRVFVIPLPTGELWNILGINMPF